MQPIRRVLALVVAALSMTVGVVAIASMPPSPASAAEAPAGEFSPLWETPVLSDTTVPANGKIAVQVLGKGGIPASGVSAASLKYTVKNAGEFGWLEVYPTDQAAPNLSTVSYYPAERTTNADLTRITSTGQIYVANHSGQPITVSVTTDGYFLDGVVTGTIVSRNGGRCVDVAGANTADGTAIQLYDCNGNDAQKITLAADGTLRVFGKCVDITAGDFNNGTKLQLYTCNGSPAQQWVPHYDDGTIVNPGSGRCFDAAAAGTENHTLLQIWDCNGSAGQYWDIPRATGGKTGYEPLPTNALFDSRYGVGVPSQTTPIPANGSLTIDVHGRVGIPTTADEVGAVALNVLATQQTAAGTLGLHPSDAPESSAILAFNTSESNSVFTIAQMSGTGKLTIENNSTGTVHVLISVRGYFTWTDATNASMFQPMQPSVVLDTLAGTGVEGGFTDAVEPDDEISVDSFSVIPSALRERVTAVTVTINARRPTSYGWISVYGGADDPDLSSLNYSPDESNVGFDSVMPASDGEVTFVNHSTGTVHLQIYVTGYFVAPKSDETTSTGDNGEDDLSNDGENTYEVDLATLEPPYGVAADDPSLSPDDPEQIATYDAPDTATGRTRAAFVDSGLAERAANWKAPTRQSIEGCQAKKAAYGTNGWGLNRFSWCKVSEKAAIVKSGPWIRSQVEYRVTFVAHPNNGKHNFRVWWMVDKVAYSGSDYPSSALMRLKINLYTDLGKKCKWTATAGSDNIVGPSAVVIRNTIGDWATNTWTLGQNYGWSDVTCQNPQDFGKKQVSASFKPTVFIRSARTDVTPRWYKGKKAAQSIYSASFIRCEYAREISWYKKGCDKNSVMPWIKYWSSNSDMTQAVTHLRDALYNSSNTVPANGLNLPGDSRFDPLTRLYGPDSSKNAKDGLVQQNRNASIALCRLHFGTNYTTGGKQCDEFPFASTWEGAAMAPNPDVMSVRPINGEHNENAGTALGTFYQNDRVINRDHFYVVVD